MVLTTYLYKLKSRALRGFESRSITVWLDNTISKTYISHAKFYI